jgi:predicted transcriptional regulator
MLPERAMVESVMSSPLITIEPEASLGEAMLVMEEKKVRRLFVVEKGKITGRVTQTGALGQMLDVMMALSAGKIRVLATLVLVSTARFKQLRM